MCIVKQLHSFPVAMVHCRVVVPERCSGIPHARACRPSVPCITHRIRSASHVPLDKQARVRNFPPALCAIRCVVPPVSIALLGEGVWVLRFLRTGGGYGECARAPRHSEHAACTTAGRGTTMLSVVFSRSVAAKAPNVLRRFASNLRRCTYRVPTGGMAMGPEFWVNRALTAE